ncbi:acetyl-CoA synthetase-like protein [Hypoxylon sp. FL1284]|nr:acetyl-CoA synthetase-like protein [Hypoxylon sp. FL1284]
MVGYKTLQDVLRHKAKSDRPGRLLLYPLGNTSHPTEITYTRLYEEAQRLSLIIRLLDNFRTGHPILLHFDDHWDIVLLFWSVLFAGGLPVLSSPLSNVENDRRRHIQALSSLLESPICFTRLRFLPMFGNNPGIHLQPIEHLLEETESFERDTGTCQNDTNKGSPAQDLGHNGAVTYNGMNDESPAVQGPNHGKGQEIGKRDLVMLMLTSGSTGNAKAVQFTHGQVLAAVTGKAAVRLLPPGLPLLNWIRLDHVAGLIEIHLQALWLGTDQVHVSPVDIVPSPRNFLDLLSRHRVSRTFAPNFFLAKLVLAMKSGPVDRAWDLSSLTCVASGGEANDVATCIAASALFARYGAPPGVIMTGFGMTETCAGAIFNVHCPSYDVAQGHTVASVGKCMMGIEMRVSTPANPGGLAAPGEPGDLEVRGPVVFRDYYRNPVATAQAFTSDGWFQTEDRGSIDSNGNLILLGRTKEVININGVKLVTADIQNAIEKALGDLVARLIVFATKAAYTERVTIAYVPNAFPVRDEETVYITRLATQACWMSTETRPLVFGIREESLPLLPVSTLGKISRPKMARLVENGEFTMDLELHEQAIQRTSLAAASNGPELVSKAEARLIEDVAETLGRIPEDLTIHPATSLFDAGFTSMHFIKLKFHIERRLGTNIPVIEIMKNSTISGLATYLEGQLQRSKPGAPRQGYLLMYDPVVVFRPNGSKTPLWLIHPGVGEVLVFVGLAQQLAADGRPVFALRAAGFERNQLPFSSIDQAVDVYVAAIRRRQPRGPYALAGYSYGTMLAFEAAKRLSAGGYEVRFLGSFNLPPHIKHRIRQLNWNACLLHLSHFLGLITEETSDVLEVDPSFRQLPLAEAIEGVLGLADTSRLEELGLERDALLRWVNVSFGLQDMAKDYEPSGKVNSIDIFHAAPLRAAAESREIWLREHLSRWADFVVEPPRFHAVQGAHYTMIGPEHVTSFAQTLIKALEARGV